MLTRIRRFYFIVILSAVFSGLSGCENTDVQLAAEAGIDAYKAATLSDQAVVELSVKSSAAMDSQHRVAPADSTYTKRLQALVGDLYERDDYTFDYKVYLKDDVNAFAMADGTIRIYSGLMDLFEDGELCFVIGHEMGHVVKQHTRKQLRLAYAASAVRRGIASQEGGAADIARSQLGGLVERLMGAKFSQFEEKVADDYGLAFLKSKGYAPEYAVSALKKLAGLESGHSFLSSHPDPGLRAERISLQIQGKTLSVEETQQDLIGAAKPIILEWYDRLHGLVARLLKI